MLDAGCSILDAGCWILDTGDWQLGNGVRCQVSGVRIAGCWALETGHLILDARYLRCLTGEVISTVGSCPLFSVICPPIPPGQQNGSCAGLDNFIFLIEYLFFKSQDTAVTGRAGLHGFDPLLDMDGVSNIDRRLELPGHFQQGQNAFFRQLVGQSRVDNDA